MEQKLYSSGQINRIKIGTHSYTAMPLSQINCFKTKPTVKQDAILIQYGQTAKKSVLNKRFTASNNTANLQSR